MRVIVLWILVNKDVDIYLLSSSGCANIFSSHPASLTSRHWFGGNVRVSGVRSPAAVLEVLPLSLSPMAKHYFLFYFRL